MVHYNTEPRVLAVHAVAWIAFWVSASASPSETGALWLYELTTRTGMPHLEESLRYTTKAVERCLSSDELMVAFEVLSHESLRSCRLEPATQDADTASYRLKCRSPDITGSAIWNLGAHQKTGTLNVKLGGKNMTFFQRVAAKPLRQCVREDG